MTEKIIVSPLRVRGLGDVVSPKSTQDFSPYGCTVASSTDASLGTVFTDSYLAKSTLSLEYDRLIDSEAESFTVKATLKDSSGSAISSASVYLAVNDGEPTSATTNSSGVASFTVTTTGADEYDFKVYYSGTGSVCGSFAYGIVRVGSVSDLELYGNKSIIETGDKVGLWAKLVGTGALKGAIVKFYEQWTPAIRVSSDKTVFQSGTDIDLSAQLYDSTDGSLVKEAGHNISFIVEQNEITMFKGNETFSRVGTGTGILNISYSQDNELVYTAGSGIYFHSDLMFQANDNWECEFKFKATGTEGGRFGIYRASSTDAEKECIALKCQSNSVILNTQTGSGSMSSSTIASSYSSYHTFKVASYDDNVKIWLDGTLKTRVELDWLFEPLCFGLHGWTTGNVIYVKDFSFKESD